MPILVTKDFQFTPKEKDYTFLPGLTIPSALVPPAGPFLVAEQEIAERSQFNRGLFTRRPLLKISPPIPSGRQTFYEGQSVPTLALPNSSEPANHSITQNTLSKRTGCFRLHISFVTGRCSAPVNRPASCALLFGTFLLRKVQAGNGLTSSPWRGKWRSGC